MQEAKALVRLCGSSEPSLLPDVITTKLLANIVFGAYFFGVGVSIDISMALSKAIWQILTKFAWI